MTRWLVIAALGIALAGCEQRGERDTGRPAEQPGTTGEPSERESIRGEPQSPGEEGMAIRLGAQDQDFLRQAAQANLMEIKFAEVVTRQSQNDQVKELAQSILQDHRDLKQKLGQAAGKHGLQLREELDPQHQNRIESMSNLSGPEFDRAFLIEMITAHQKAIDLFQTQADQGQNSELKSLASSTLPTLRQHLQKAQELQGGAAGTEAGRMNAAATAPAGEQ